MLRYVYDFPNRFSVYLLRRGLRRVGFRIDQTAICGAISILMSDNLVIHRRLATRTMRCRLQVLTRARLRLVYVGYKTVERLGSTALGGSIKTLGVSHFAPRCRTLCVCNLYDGYGCQLRQGGWRCWRLCGVWAVGISILLKLR